MNIKKISIIGFWFSVILGSLFHFGYEFFNNNILIGYFMPVNESTFEHLKLISTPILLFSIIEYFLYGKNMDNFFIIKVISILIGSLSVIILFYTYTGIIGKNFLLIDIGLFIISVFFAYYFSCISFKNNILNTNISKTVGIILIFIILITSFIFTTNPPKIPLFKDPLTKSYGVD